MTSRLGGKLAQQPTASMIAEQTWRAHLAHTDGVDPEPAGESRQFTIEGTGGAG